MAERMEHQSLEVGGQIPTDTGQLVGDHPQTRNRCWSERSDCATLERTDEVRQGPARGEGTTSGGERAVEHERRIPRAIERQIARKDEQPVTDGLPRRDEA